eukprot:5201532-Pleurochrysis_carterae.AAC.2
MDANWEWIDAVQQHRNQLTSVLLASTSSVSTRNASDALREVKAHLPPLRPETGNPKPVMGKRSAELAGAPRNRPCPTCALYVKKNLPVSAKHCPFAAKEMGYDPVCSRCESGKAGFWQTSSVPEGSSEAAREENSPKRHAGVPKSLKDPTMWIGPARLYGPAAGATEATTSDKAS